MKRSSLIFVLFVVVFSAQAAFTQTKKKKIELPF